MVLAQIVLFSKRYLALKAEVVVRTMFFLTLSVAETMTGLLTPFFAKASLILFRSSSELIGVELVWMRINRLELRLFLGVDVAGVFFLFVTVVHSGALGRFFAVTLAYELSLIHI